MDWTLHAAAGAMIGWLLLGRQAGKQTAIASGTLLGIAPTTLDAFASLWLSPSANMVFQRAATLSPVPWALALWLLPRWLATGPHRALPTRPLRTAIALIWAAHAALASLAMPGSQLLWPFPAPRLAFPLLSPDDAAPAILLALTLAATLRQSPPTQDTKRPNATTKPKHKPKSARSAFTKPKSNAKSAPKAATRKPKSTPAHTPSLPRKRRPHLWLATLTAAYFGIALTAKWVTSRAFHSDLSRRHANLAATTLTTLPTAWNPLLWRGLATNGDSIWLGYRSLLDPPTAPTHWAVLPKRSDSLRALPPSPHAQRILAQTHGWWIARPNKSGLWLANVAAGEARFHGARKDMVDLRLRQSWQLEPSSPNHPVQPIQPSPNHWSPDHTARTFWRTLGRSASWDAIPRLAGIPGSLPEPLEFHNGS